MLNVFGQYFSLVLIQRMKYFKKGLETVRVIKISISYFSKVFHEKVKQKTPKLLSNFSKLNNSSKINQTCRTEIYRTKGICSLHRNAFQKENSDSQFQGTHSFLASRFNDNVLSFYKSLTC